MRRGAWGTAEPEWFPGPGVECLGQFGVGHPQLRVVPEHLYVLEVALGLGVGPAVF